MAEISPFIYDGPLPPDDVDGRDEIVDELLSLGQAGRFVRLYAPRRYGKTSVLRRVATVAPRKRPAQPVVMVDLYGLVSMADMAIRLETAYRNLPDGRWRREISRAFAGAGLGLSLAGAGISAQFAKRDASDPLPILHATLDLPLKAVPDGTRALVIFDEFQAVQAVPELDAIIRSHIQHQRDVASFVFAGSEQGMLNALFADVAKPLYGQATPLELTRLGDDVVAGIIDKKFQMTKRSPGDALAPLVTLADGHPQRAMLLAHLLWAQTRTGKRSTIEDFEAAVEVALSQSAPEMTTMWGSLDPNESRVLRAIAYDGSPYRKETAALLGLKKATAADAVKRLVSASVIEESESTSSYRIIDPFLKEWVRRRFPEL